VIEITREEVKLKESEAKGEVIDYKQPNGKVEKFGWLTVPSFYAEMDRHGEADAKSTTKDVRKILDRMKREGIGGLVIDLRRDGEGRLRRRSTSPGSSSALAPWFRPRMPREG